MKTFRDHPAFKAYQHPHKEKILKYMELMYSIASDLNKIDNLQERKSSAAQKAGLKPEETQDIFDEKDEKFQDLRHVYLSDYQFHAKYTNLQTFLQMLWRLQRDAFNLEELKQMNDSVDLMEKLEGKCARLFSEIYGSNEIIEVAKENIRKATRLEDRLVQTKKKL